MEKQREKAGFLHFGRMKSRAGQIEEVDPRLIQPNPAQPRRFFEPDAIASLADSIRQHGMIQPMTVRRLPDGRYELIAGERRLRAALLIGMEKAPCVVREADERESAALAILENLQREDLNLFEEAEAIASLIRVCALTQEAAAARLSVSQSFVANKLRLLRFSEEERREILSAGLTERHARALLRLNGTSRAEAMAEIIARRMNVAQTEAYIDRLLAPDVAPDPPDALPIRRESNRMQLTRDVRLFCNSVNNALEIMRRSGVPAVSHRRETDSALEILIQIPRT